MKLNKNNEKEIDSNSLFTQISNCKPEGLEDLLNQIQTMIEQSVDKDSDLLTAKTMVTSRLASTRGK